MRGPLGTSIAHAEAIHRTGTETLAQLKTLYGSAEEGVRTSTSLGAPLAEFPRPQATVPVSQSAHSNFLAASATGLASIEDIALETTERIVAFEATRSAFAVEPGMAPRPAASDSLSPLSSLTATPDFIHTPPNPDAMEDEGNEVANGETEDDAVDDETPANDGTHVDAPGNYHDLNDADAEAYSDDEVMLLEY